MSKTTQERRKRFKKYVMNEKHDDQKDKHWEKNGKTW